MLENKIMSLPLHSLGCHALQNAWLVVLPQPEWSQSHQEMVVNAIRAFSKLSKSWAHIRGHQQLLPPV